MSTGKQEQLEAVHICGSCGSAIERAAVNPASLINGLVHCPTCHQDTALDLKIQGTHKKRPPKREEAVEGN